MEVIRNAVNPAYREQLAKVKVDEEHKKKKDRALTNAVVGAFIGGAIDSSLGDDDSVIDGALIGGITGYALSDTNKPVAIVDLTENTSHFVNLYFRDGLSVTVSASNEEIAQLFRLASSAKNNDKPISGAIKTCGATEEQLRLGKELRLNMEIKKRMSPALSLIEPLCLLTFPVSVMVMAFFGVHLVIVGTEMFNVGGIAILLVLSLLSYYIMHVAQRSKTKIKESILQNGHLPTPS